MPDNGGRRIDHVVAMAVGVPVDLGWSVAVLHADHTVTRTCKGCGVSATTAVDAGGRVREAPLVHDSACPVWPRLGNNPTFS